MGNYFYFFTPENKEKENKFVITLSWDGTYNSFFTAKGFLSNHILNSWSFIEIDDILKNMDLPEADKIIIIQAFKQVPFQFSTALLSKLSAIYIIKNNKIPILSITIKNFKSTIKNYALYLNI